MKPWFNFALLTLAFSILLVSCKSYSPPADIPVVQENRVVLRGEMLVEMPGEVPSRYYILNIPEHIDPIKPAPLVLMFHGGGGTPENIRNVSRFNRLAEQYGFVVAYPSGTGSNPRFLYWNVLASRTYASQENMDDLGFVERLIKDIINKTNVDTNRIYAAGFSQGGMLSYRLACDPNLSAKIAAIATVGATMTVPHEQCHASRPMSVISFHGAKDPIILYEGGISSKIPRNDRIARDGVEEGLMYWIKLSGLDTKPVASGSRGAADMRQYGPNEQGQEIVSWVLQDGGHTWPGGTMNLPEWLMGPINRDIDASTLIWDFFSRHQLP